MKKVLVLLLAVGVLVVVVTIIRSVDAPIAYRQGLTLEPGESYVFEDAFGQPCLFEATEGTAAPPDRQMIRRRLAQVRSELRAKPTVVARRVLPEVWDYLTPARVALTFLQDHLRVIHVLGEVDGVLVERELVLAEDGAILFARTRTTEAAQEEGAALAVKPQVRVLEERLYASHECVVDYEQRSLQAPAGSGLEVSIEQVGLVDAGAPLDDLTQYRRLRDDVIGATKEQRQQEVRGSILRDAGLPYEAGVAEPVAERPALAREPGTP
ncbi:MAG: hypothetical protein OXU20_23805 [Myxococcales bacterium]|nr:hypothetical protein [Myxococcales bacterium]MDD9967379.1 hypothetical protein [Myxococcales bacterium]